MSRPAFTRLLRAEWTKFRSVRRWVVTAVAAGLLPVVLSAVFATMSSTNANEYPFVYDQFRFVHQSLTGDGTLVARVASQAGSHEWARAGLMLKQALESESPYAAVYVTPAHGVRLESNFQPSVAGGAGGAPVWLRLTRSADTVAADESADGATWRPVGTVTLAGLPGTVEIGLFVNSPGILTIDRQFGSTRTVGTPTLGKATFDHVSRSGPWLSEDVGEPVDPPQVTGMTESAGTFTLTGSGDITWQWGGDDDAVLNSLSGVLVALILVAVLGVLTMTSEFRRGLVRTTFTATPRRGRVLAAKAVVVAAVSFVAGLFASVGSYLLARPILAANGFAAPAYPELPLTDPQALRAVVGAAAMLALVGVLGLAVGALLRGTAGAVTLALVVFLLPTVFATALPLDPALWIGRATPVAGLAVMQTRSMWNTATTPWGGLGVLAAYAVATLALAVWRIRRRDA